MQGLFRIGAGRRRIAVAILMAIFVCATVAAPRARAITVYEEEELAREFMNVLLRHYQIVRDPLVTDYLRHIGQKLLKALPPQPFEYHFYMIEDPSYNAFATPAGHIFINSGLVAALGTEDQLAGIMGHEIAHVVCRHISQKIERSKKLSAVTLAGAIAGVLLGSAGAGEAAGALTMGSLAAGQSLALSYSRDDERQADQLGLKNLTKAGYRGEGLLAGLRKIRSRQWYGTEQIPTYLLTHPGVEERMAYIDNWIHHEPQPPPRPVEPQFERFHTWVSAMYVDPAIAGQRYANAVARHPEDPMAHYGYALALDRNGNSQAALAHLRQALAKRPLEPYFLKDLGRIYFETGRFEEALGVLEGVVATGTSPPEALFYLGRTQFETGREQEAVRNLDVLVARHPDYLEARYFLGQSLGRVGRLPEAYYHIGLYHWALRDLKNARLHLERALDGIDSEMRQAQIRDILKEIDGPHPDGKEKKSQAVPDQLRFSRSSLYRGFPATAETGRFRPFAAPATSIPERFPLLR
ncbi:MAG: M48 family metalloprotease [Desulfobacterales bacterium]|jgi:predicted Zn-dependent protease|nr:M48 family metalloprotease [Desulfobacterales bacterium]